MPVEEPPERLGVLSYCEIARARQRREPRQVRAEREIVRRVVVPAAELHERDLCERAGDGHNNPYEERGVGPVEHNPLEQRRRGERRGRWCVGGDEHRAQFYDRAGRDDRRDRSELLVINERCRRGARSDATSDRGKNATQQRIGQREQWEE